MPRMIWMVSLFMVTCLAQGPQSGSGAPAKQPTRLASELLFQVELHQLAPSEVALKEGYYRFRINNGRYVKSLDFVLDDPQAARLFTAKTSERGLRMHIEVELRPGRHVLSVPGYPELRSILTVTPNTPKGNWP